MLLFIDGFTHYSTNELDMKYNASNDFSAQSLDTTEARRADTQCLKIDDGASAYIDKSITSSETIVVGFAIKYPTIPSGSNYGVFTLYGDGSQQVTLICKTDGHIEINRGAYNGTQIGTTAGSFSMQADVWYYFELKVTLGEQDGSPQGAYSFKVNGTTIISDDNVDTEASSADGLDSFRFRGVNGVYTYIQDLYVADTTGSYNNDFLGDCRIDTLYPSSDGSVTWSKEPDSGSNYEKVDDESSGIGDIDEDTSYVYTSTTDNTDRYGYDDLSDLNDATIHAVASTICARKDDAGTRKIRPVTYIGTTTHTGDEHTLSDNYVIYQDFWEVNPDDTAAWEEADVNGAQFGVRLTA